MNTTTKQHATPMVDPFARLSEEKLATVPTVTPAEASKVLAACVQAAGEAAASTFAPHVDSNVRYR